MLITHYLKYTPVLGFTWEVKVLRCKETNFCHFVALLRESTVFIMVELHICFCEWFSVDLLEYSTNENEPTTILITNHEDSLCNQKMFGMSNLLMLFPKSVTWVWNDWNAILKYIDAFSGVLSLKWCTSLFWEKNKKPRL